MHPALPIGRARSPRPAGLNTDITRQFIGGALANGETVDPTIRAVYGYANGTSFHPGGMAWVGERGPELLSLPRGAQVIPNAQSMRLAGTATTIQRCWPR